MSTRTHANVRPIPERTLTMSTEPRLVDVRVDRDTSGRQECTGDTAEYWEVHPIWADVDRPDVGGWLVRGEKLARRLERAIRAGAALGPAVVMTDIHGQTYVNAPHKVMGRHLNADLRRLGY
jgi:hypothetical protein